MLLPQANDWIIPCNDPCPNRIVNSDFVLSPFAPQDERSTNTGSDPLELQPNFTAPRHALDHIDPQEGIDASSDDIFLLPKTIWHQTVRHQFPCKNFCEFMLPNNNNQPPSRPMPDSIATNSTSVAATQQLATEILPPDKVDALIPTSCLVLAENPSLKIALLGSPWSHHPNP